MDVSPPWMINVGRASGLFPISQWRMPLVGAGRCCLRQRFSFTLRKTLRGQTRPAQASFAGKSGTGGDACPTGTQETPGAWKKLRGNLFRRSAKSKQDHRPRMVSHVLLVLLRGHRPDPVIVPAHGGGKSHVPPPVPGSPRFPLTHEIIPCITLRYWSRSQDRKSTRLN